MRRNCPVAYNPTYGGFWMISSYDDISTVARDRDRFSSFYSKEPVDGIDYIGIFGKPTIPRTLGIGLHEVPEDLHLPLRRAITPYFSPARAAAMRREIEQHTAWFVDERIESGTIDVCGDLVGPVSALATMRLVGLPLSEWRNYNSVFRGTTYDAAEVDRAALEQQITEMATTLLGEIERRRAEPQDDLLTAFAQAQKLDGEPFDPMELLGQVWFVISGGLDTTTSLAAWTFEYLGRSPDLRQQLVDDPDAIPSAIEEFLRLFPVNETLSRTVTEDVSLGGRQLRRGDHVLVSWLSANRDEQIFDDPEVCRLDRAVNPHLAFGAGGHRCIGMHVAKQIFEVVLREVLRRLPDYTVADLRVPPCMPLMRSVTSLVLAFPAGAREHPPAPLDQHGNVGQEDE